MQCNHVEGNTPKVPPRVPSCRDGTPHGISSGTVVSHYRGDARGTRSDALGSDMNVRNQLQNGCPSLNLKRKMDTWDIH